MNVTKLSKTDSTDDEYVFETSPPLTDQILMVLNQRDRDPATHYKTKNGKLVITKEQMDELTSGHWSKKPAKVFSEILTEIEQELTTQATDREHSKQRRMEQTAEFFGVPLE